MFRDNDGSTIGILSLVQDVTNSKQAELDLKEAESKFRNLVEESMVGVYIIQNENIVYANPVFAEIFGYNHAEMEGEFSIEKIVHIDDLQKVIDNISIRIEG